MINNAYNKNGFLNVLIISVHRFAPIRSYSVRFYIVLLYHIIINYIFVERVQLAVVQ